MSADRSVPCRQTSPTTAEDCPICAIHRNRQMIERYEIRRSRLWILRHHPDPSPLKGWLLLDSIRHCSGPIDFLDDEASDWGDAVRHASRLVRGLTGCDRVYAIAFGEGAPHLHLHLIPRFISNPATSAWSVADYYRSVELGDCEAAPAKAVEDVVHRARRLTI